MSRPRAGNRLSEWQKAALSNAILTVVQREGGYGRVVSETGLRQPLVSLALHRRLVTRTDGVVRLFEYLAIDRRSEQRSEQDDGADREQRLLGLLAGLSDGSFDADQRLEAMLAALNQFSKKSGGTARDDATVE